MKGTLIKFFVALAVVASCAHAFAQESYEQLVEDYIDKYKDIAIREMEKNGIPASITLAQGIIESSAGQSPLATKANNHFGIKCHDDWTGKTFYYDDDKKNECFRKYPSAEESFDDHSAFLKRDRYAVLFTYNIMDYKAWAKGLKECGYATNPHYADLLTKCIEDYDLHQWDMNEKDRQKWFAQINDVKQDSDKEKKDSLPSTTGIENNEMFSEQWADANKRIEVFNDVKSIVLQPGEMINEVATTYEIGLKRLLRYNDMTDAAQVKAGDRIFLQPKRKNGDTDFHIVQQGENMFGISQLHGIQLPVLYERNLMQLGEQPATGDTLFLRKTRTTAPAVKTGDGSFNTNETNVSELNIADAKYYTVTQGDTLYSISKKYNLSITTLKELNDMSTDHLYIGQRLKVE